MHKSQQTLLLHRAITLSHPSTFPPNELPTLARIRTQPKPFHIPVTLNRHGVADTNSVNTLHRPQGICFGYAPDVGRVVRCREVRFRLVWSGVVVAEDAGPFLDGLVVVRRQKNGVCGAVVDLSREFVST